jgi:thioredoxin reductase (NADPH)
MAELDLRSIAHPRLDGAQRTRLAGCSGGAPARYESGETLFQAGDRGFEFFVVESGEVEIIDPSEEPPRPLTVHGPGEFTGDVAHLTGRPSLLTARARGRVEAYAVSQDGLRRLLNQCPDLGDVILQAFIARRQLLRESSGFKGLRVIGSRYSRDTFRVRDLLARNRVPFTWLDLENDPAVGKLLARFGLSPADTPVVCFGRMLLLRNPSDRELAETLGIRQKLAQTVYDLVIIGAGPAGLAAAVYGASEGLDTIMLERWAPGGQVSGSMRVENYLGFPTGITGSELAERAMLQAEKFGARLTAPVPATALSFDGSYTVLHLETAETVIAKALIIATGADYRRLIAEGCEPFEGNGVYYAATMNEAPLCRGAEVAVVGGGNSAGQAALFLAGIARKVTLIVRGASLEKDMSAYLARRIEHTPNIEVLLHTVVRRMHGDNHLGKIEIEDCRSGEKRERAVTALFSFIGAVPRTGWLAAQLATDAHGFICTGVAGSHAAGGDGGRQPHLLETSRRGVFAAGDVRAGSVKRVASAVGEGAMAVRFVHDYLKER